mgnify:CR=1 FL=1
MFNLLFMKIVYVSNSARIPSRDANSVHLMKMCSSYASMGHQVTLFVSTKKDKDLAVLDVYSHYGVENNFKIRRIPLPSNKIGSFISTVLFAPVLNPILTAVLIVKPTERPILQ